MANLTEKAKVYLENFNNWPKIESFDPIELKAIQAQAPVPPQDNLPSIHRTEERFIKQKMEKKFVFAFIHLKEKDHFLH